MKLAKILATVGVVGSILSSTVATAAETRAAGALPTSSHVAQPAQAAKQMGDDSQLLGAPLFLIFLGAVVITIGTIIIIHNNNGSNG